MATFKLYRVNEALSGNQAYSLVDTFTDESSALERLDPSALQSFRSFVRFEIHCPDGSRVEVARGTA